MLLMVMIMTFKVVVFTDENVMAIVPSLWLDGNICCVWLPYASRKTPVYIYIHCFTYNFTSDIHWGQTKLLVPLLHVLCYSGNHYPPDHQRITDVSDKKGDNKDRSDKQQ